MIEKKFLPPLKPKENEALLRRAIESGDPELREEYTARNMRMIAYVARKYGGSLDYDDAFGLCQFGFSKALNTFDLSKNIKFATYSIRCMTNEIYMFKRKDKRHAPSGMSLDYSITTDESGNDLKIEDVLAAPDTDPDTDLSQEADRALLKEVLEEFKKGCSERDFGIVMMFIIEQATQAEIGKRYGISQSYASRIREKLMNRLRETTERILLRKARAESAAAEEYTTKKKEEKNMPNKNTKWAPKWAGQVVYLRENYPTLSKADIARIIGLTTSSIWQCIDRMEKGTIEIPEADPSIEEKFQAWKAAEDKKRATANVKKKKVPHVEEIKKEEESVKQELDEDEVIDIPIETGIMDEPKQDPIAERYAAMQKADGVGIEMSRASAEDIQDALNFISRRIDHSKNYEFFVGFKEVK